MTGRTWLLAFGCALLLPACGQKANQLPSQLSHIPGDLANSSLALSGVYADGWTGKTAALNLKQPAGDQVLVVRGMVPKVGDSDYSGDVAVSVDNRLIDRHSFRLGDFEIVEPIGGQSGTRRIGLAFSKVQQLPRGDDRVVGARLTFVGFEQAKADADVVRSPGVHLGSGWGQLETFKNQTFRWVNNDAELQITAEKPGDLGISLTVEPGPGVAAGPFLLKVLDSSGRQVASALIGKRETVRLFVPVEAGGANEFHLHVDGGGKMTPGDPRVLNFRVFRMEAAPLTGNNPQRTSS